MGEFLTSSFARIADTVGAHLVRRVRPIARSARAAWQRRHSPGRHREGDAGSRADTGHGLMHNPISRMSVHTPAGGQREVLVGKFPNVRFCSLYVKEFRWIINAKKKQNGRYIGMACFDDYPEGYYGPPEWDYTNLAMQ